MANEQLGSLIDEHIALLTEAREERDRHKRHAKGLYDELTAEQLLNAELMAALEVFCDLLVGAKWWDIPNSNRDMHNEILAVRELIARAKSQQ